MKVMIVISLKQTNYKTPILIIILLTITIRTVPINANENDTLSLTINLPAESLVILNETGYTPD
ncbi:MAG: hypothetical protein U9O98_05855, partial [Asgard group archaeon]|nr:hypothetical protein [Asgard group archaeon]